MKPIKKATDNDISELLCLIANIQNEINQSYSHVKEFIPNTLLIQLDSFENKVEKEYDFRANEE